LKGPLWILSSALIWLVFLDVALGEEPKRIEDNSFLVEEAYNQERGVVQHIQTLQYMKDHTLSYAFTQEWPLGGKTHQFSYTIPTQRVKEPETRTGLGDAAVAYRYQWIDQDQLAVAPRLSLIFPNGNYKKGLGTDALGLQANLPLSLIFSERWVTHWNAGTTWTPNARESGGARGDTLGFGFAASLIYQPLPNINLMLETKWDSLESVISDEEKDRQESFFVSPGIRFAKDYPSGLQVVPGIAFPIGVGPSRDDYGVLVYISLEHPFTFLLFH